MKQFAGILLSALLTQTAPSQQPATPLASPASVEGRVIVSDTKAPLEDATVELVRQGAPATTTTADAAILAAAGIAPPAGAVAPPPRLFVTTTADGKFRIENVPPGAYRLYATNPGAFVPTEYGQRTVTGTGRVLALDSGQKMTDVTLAMTPTASITGRITDGNGDPLVFGSVLLFRVVYRNGARTLEITQSVICDDHGDFRVFWITPGKYLLGVTPLQPNGYGIRIGYPSRFGGDVYLSTPIVSLHTPGTGEIYEETYRWTMYPGTQNTQAARVLDLKPRETYKADFSADGGAVRALQVRGTVLDGSGRPFPCATLQLLPIKPEGGSVWIPRATSDANGNFLIRGAVPESYMLYVNGTGAVSPLCAPPGTPPPPPPPPPAPGTPPPTPQSALVPFQMGTENVDNLKVQAGPGAAIPWHVAFEPRPGTDTAPPIFRISLIRFPELLGGPTVPASPVGPNGPPVFQNVGVGDYRVEILGLPPGSYIKSIRLGNQDVLSDGLHVIGSVSETLEAVVSGNGGTLNGTVQDEKGKPFPSANVVLVPDLYLRERRFDLFKTTLSGSDGKFKFDGVPPGDYKVFAWEDIYLGDWFDPEFMRTQETRGAIVQIEEGKVKNVETTAIPAERSAQ